MYDFDLNKKLKLIKGYDKKYRRTIFNRLMLTNEEIQRRLDQNYGGKLTIVSYSGVESVGKLHCKECGIFKTKNIVGSYLNTSHPREDCEKCDFKRQLAYYDSLIRVRNLVATNYRSVYNLDNKSRYILVTVKCTDCGTVKTHRSGTLRDLGDCAVCRELRQIKEYTVALKSQDCSYLGHSYINGNQTTFLRYECLKCGRTGSKSVGDLRRGRLMCSYCNPKTIQNKSKIAREESGKRFKDSGKIMIYYKSCADIEITHLFCSHSNITEVRGAECITCNYCSPKVVRGTVKEHNKHLVQEYLIVLENVKVLKDFFMEHKQLENVPEQPRLILEHIDGWLCNYKDIVNKYPNGDLGTVLERNSLYNKCKEVFYPVMRKYNLKVKE